nr:transketolase-like protein 2 [Onthophagus taurus]
MRDVQKLKDLANKLRILTIYATKQANSGHPTTCSSIAEIISVLFFRVMKYTTPAKNPSNDRLVLSKGHAAPILYAAWTEAGYFKKSDLMTLRQFGSPFEGHPTPRLNAIDVATGSLGQGASIAAGMAYVGKNVDKADYKVYCIIGDGEAAEGSIWEACNFASHYKLNNLCIIMDVNRLGQTGPTNLGHNLDIYEKRFSSFGFHTEIVDGHCVEKLICAFDNIKEVCDKPSVIIAKTLKGKNFLTCEDNPSFHGKVLGKHTDSVICHLESLICDNNVTPPERCEPSVKIQEINCFDNKLSEPPCYKPDELVATRLAYGTALVKLIKENERILAFDCDTSNSTYAEKVKFEHPKNFVECFIAEQNMVGVAIGAACRNRTVAFCSSFAAFLTRAFDQIRMGAISQSNVNFSGSHCGVTIGADGPSQMGLEDIAMFRSIPGCTIFYPSDAVACERAVELAANTKGMTFIRTTRPKTKMIYPNNEKFEIGKSKVIKESEEDKVLIIAGGITIHESLGAYCALKRLGIKVRIMDLFTINPIDKEGIICNAQQCHGKILTIEDHYATGGLGDAVLSAVAEEKDIIVRKIAVKEIAGSASPQEQLDFAGLSSNFIVEAVKRFAGCS